MKKKLNIIFIAVFMLILIIPIVFINIRKNQVSEIDNRKLAELDGVSGFSIDAITAAVLNLADYFGDRVGFREEMINMKQYIDDKLFGVLGHPTYEYGKDGHIFVTLEPEITEYSYYLSVYADFIKQMSDYSKARGAEFYCALNPSKKILYEEYLPDGVNYDFADYKALVGYLNDRDIKHLDLSVPLFEAKNRGIPVCNVKYDAEHWNANGAFRGISAILEMIGTDYPSVKPLDINDFVIGSELQTTLHTSRFPIREFTPVYTLKTSEQQDITYELAGQLNVGQAFPFYIHLKNPGNPDAPKLFMFHGSHIRDEYKPFIAENFSEAIFVYSYFIIADLPYYFNIFQPDIVLYEVADRSIYSLLDFASLQNTVLSPPVSRFAYASETDVFTINNITELPRAFNPGGTDTLIRINTQITGGDLGYTYIKINDTYLDCSVKKAENGAEMSVTLDKRQLENCEEIEIVLVSGDGMTIQHFSLNLFE